MAGWNRRRFLAGSAASLAFSQRGRAQEAVDDWALFHTTDLHGHILPTESYGGEKDLGGLARCASQIRAWRKQSPNNLLLDVGDVFQGTLVSWQTRGKLMIELFNKMGYDAWVLGNHEFDWGPEVVEQALNLSEMPVLAANVEVDGKRVGADRDEGLFCKLKPWILKEIGGEKVGVIGLTTPGLSSWLRPELLGPLRAVDPQPVLERCVAELKSEGATKIVVAGHMGFRQWGDDYANPLAHTLKGSGVDTFIGAHSHQRNARWLVEGVPCTQASYHGLHCGRVRFYEDLARLELSLMDRSIETDPVVMEASRPFVEKALLEQNREIGRLGEPIEGVENVRRLLVDAFERAAHRAKLEVDAVFHGTFGETKIEAGPFTIGDAWRLLPYENRLVVGELTEEEILAVLHQSEKVSHSDRALLGLKVIREGKRAVAIEASERRKRYRILCNSFDAQSGGRKLTSLRDALAKPAAKSRMLPLGAREALIDFIADA